MFLRKNGFTSLGGLGVFSLWVGIQTWGGGRMLSISGNFLKLFERRTKVLKAILFIPFLQVRKYYIDAKDSNITCQVTMRKHIHYNSLATGQCIH